MDSVGRLPPSPVPLTGREQPFAVDCSLRTELTPSTSSECCQDQFGKISIAAPAREAIVRGDRQGALRLLNSLVLTGAQRAADLTPETADALVATATGELQQRDQASRSICGTSWPWGREHTLCHMGSWRLPETAMQASLLATRLTQRMSMSAKGVSDVYYTTWLRSVGCTAYAREEAVLLDDAELATTGSIDWADPREALGFWLHHLFCRRRPFELG